jgi:hypothetical protein
MQQQINQEVEKAASLEIDVEKQKQERIRLQDQQNVMTNLRRESHQKGIQLRQLQAENKLLDQEHLSGYENEVLKQHQTIAQRDIEIAQRQDYLRLRRENEERQRKIHEEDSRIIYMASEEFQTNQKISAAVALDNQKLKQRELDQKQLHDQLKANQVLYASANMAKYAEDQDIPLDSIMSDISSHLDQMESSGIPKVEAVRLAGKRFEEVRNEEQRRNTIVARVQHYRTNAHADTWNRVLERVKSHYGSVTDFDEVQQTWNAEQFNELMGRYESAVYEQTRDRVKFL